MSMGLVYGVTFAKEDEEDYVGRGATSLSVYVFRAKSGKSKGLNVMTD